LGDLNEDGIILKLILEKIGTVDVDWIKTAQGRIL
jgi:hypothetical protein